MKKLNRNTIKLLLLVLITIFLNACKTQLNQSLPPGIKMPLLYPDNFVLDSNSVASISWRNFFKDSYLCALIDSAMLHNQDLKIVMQEVEISKNEVRAKRGEYLPFLNMITGSGVEKTPHFTRMGMVEKELPFAENKKFPDPMQDFQIGVQAKWELDIWKKLRNDKMAANKRYLASIEGKNFMQTQLVSEIAESYYELLALDNFYEVLVYNITLQSKVLRIAEQQMASAKINQLAVNRFEAQLLNMQNQQFEVKQRIIEMENRLRFLCGNFNDSIPRDASQFLSFKIDMLSLGLPAQILLNRTDVRKAELLFQASKLDVLSARANFFPRIGLVSAFGFQSFNPNLIIHPESILLNLAADLAAPLVNKNGIKALYSSANARQLQSAFFYQQTILSAFLEVQNQYWMSLNYAKRFEVKNKEVNLLFKSTTVANNLFLSAHADYSEVLFTQREALAAKMELIEIRKNQFSAQIQLYRTLGGGWRLN